MSLRDWWSDLMAGDLVAVALLVIGGMLAALAYAVVKAVAGGLWSFGRSQVEQQFWRDGGKLTTLLSLTVLVLAYAFYGHEQPRPLAGALADLARDKLLAVLPLATARPESGRVPGPTSRRQATPSANQRWLSGLGSVTASPGRHGSVRCRGAAGQP
ncbi:hypothetical protein ACFPIJ_42355 [Dactylosporangium cerinum]|uniref:Uncharacterized protein n=1 Tax=Dactylosporangium cerinum TaxID=1434730 RepID=A0ABV9WAL8_9ACTN